MYLPLQFAQFVYLVSLELFTFEFSFVDLPYYLSTMPPRRNAASSKAPPSSKASASSKASTATPCVFVFTSSSGILLKCIIFRRPKPRAAAKKVIKSSEFIDDEAEESWVSGAVLLYLSWGSFSVGDSDDDMRSVRSASTVASKLDTTTPFVFFSSFLLRSWMCILQTSSRSPFDKEGS